MDNEMQGDEFVDAVRINLRSRRKQLKLTQVAVAEKSGISQATIAQYEAGLVVPSLPSLAKLAEALNTVPAILTTPGAFSAVASA